MTKAGLFCGCALLLAGACNRGDNALFGPDEPPSSNDGGSSLNASGGSAATAGAAPSGVSGGGVAGSANGGATAGAAPAGRAAGGRPSPPEPLGGAGAGGADNGAGAASGGSAEPPDPVCGNGVIEADEQCDGGSGKTGCDEKCRVVCSDHGEDTVESEDHHCYRGYDADDFEGAQQACSKLGGHLATLASAAENELILEFIRESKFVGGFEDVPLSSEGNGAYKWVTGEPFQYTNWAEREPDRAASRCGTLNDYGRCYEHCIAVTGDGSWIDQRCDRADGYVCEWDPPGSK